MIFVRKIPFFSWDKWVQFNMVNILRAIWLGQHCKQSCFLAAILRKKKLTGLTDWVPMWLIVACVRLKKNAYSTVKLFSKNHKYSNFNCELCWALFIQQEQQTLTKDKYANLFLSPALFAPRLETVSHKMKVFFSGRRGFGFENAILSSVFVYLLRILIYCG